jgi:hypothetical protein
MKCIFNDDGSMFLYARGREHTDIPGKTSIKVPDDLDIYKTVVIDDTPVRIEVNLGELQERLREYMGDYVNARKNEYPSVPDQLDLLYHSGYDGWKATVAAIKEKYPKTK